MKLQHTKIYGMQLVNTKRKYIALNVTIINKGKALKLLCISRS